MAGPFACPVCGSATGVQETRANPSGLRRRRRCVRTACDGRITTIEVPHAGKWTRVDQRLVLVPVAELDALIALAGSLLPESPG